MIPSLTELMFDSKCSIHAPVVIDLISDDDVAPVVKKERKGKTPVVIDLISDDDVAPGVIDLISDDDEPRGGASSASGGEEQSKSPGDEIIDLTNSHDLGKSPTHCENLYLRTTSLSEDQSNSGDYVALFTKHAMKPGTLVGIYTGDFMTNAEYKKRYKEDSNVGRYAIEVYGVEMTILPKIGEGEASPNHINDPMSAINEPGSTQTANCFARTVKLDIGMHAFYHVCIYTCVQVKAGEELTWMYGLHFDRVGYKNGEPCADKLIKELHRRKNLEDSEPMLRASMEPRPGECAHSVLVSPGAKKQKNRRK